MNMLQNSHIYYDNVMLLEKHISCYKSWNLMVLHTGELLLFTIGVPDHYWTIFHHHFPLHYISGDCDIVVAYPLRFGVRDGVEGWQKGQVCCCCGIR